MDSTERATCSSTGSGISSSSSNQDVFVYAVIEFVLDNVSYVSTCPLAWIKDDSCKWPAKRGIERKAIANCMMPEKDWKILENIKILRKFTTYKESLDYEQKKSKTSDDSSEEVATRKRKTKKNSKYRDDSISPPPIMENSVGEVQDPVSSDSNVSHRSEELQRNASTPVPSEELHVMSEIENPLNLQSVTFERIIEDAEITLVSRRNFDDVWKLVMEIKIQNEIIIDRLSHIEKVIAGNLSLINPNVEGIQLPKLPFAALVDFNDFETKLQQEEMLQTCLLNFLKFIGGTDPKVCINKCLDKIFSNYVGQFCSWTGKKGNLKLSDTVIMKIIKKAVQTSFPTMTECVFESYTKAWFNHAKTRFQREKKSQD